MAVEDDPCNMRGSYYFGSISGEHTFGSISRFNFEARTSVRRAMDGVGTLTEKLGTFAEFYNFSSKRG